MNLEYKHIGSIMGEWNLEVGDWRTWRKWKLKSPNLWRYNAKEELKKEEKKKEEEEGEERKEEKEEEKKN